ncbi:hypothetical protein PAMP_021862 [Pampus punctatissimus]
MSRRQRISAIGAGGQHLRDAQAGEREGKKEGRKGDGGVWGGGVIWTHLDCPENPNESCACNRSPCRDFTELNGRPAMSNMLRIAETVALGVVGLSGQAVCYRSL